MSKKEYGHRFLDVTGKKFGRLTATKRTTPIGEPKTKWLCKCDCGNEAEVYITYLTLGDTQSCGCLKKELEEKQLREDYNKKRVDGVAMQLFKGKEPRKDSSTGYRGVSRYYTRKSKQERYRATITVKGQIYRKAGFKTAKDAYYNGRLVLEDEHLPKKENENENK